MLENKGGRVGGSAGKGGGGSFKQQSGKGPPRRHFGTHRRRSRNDLCGHRKEK